jgi:hypothetical protein
MTEALPIKPRYRYYYSTEGPSPHGTSSEPTKAEAQEFVNASLGLLTGGCELCLHNDRMFCQKRKRLVEFGDTRCEYFTRRTAAKGLDSIGI